ncbi:hypothetical protein DYB28_004811 [Aphanomyces astaci]|uniref:CLASP N-terminal domain-containing protein n=1 Tax=Aphanomyces astaci TaxID=112090 RepID=A0A9X8HCQ1_APHAT|nr:hypothetical protein DYB28_004811 [Aphanomyces astaci]
MLKSKGPYNVKAIESSLQNQVDWMKRIQALQLIQAWAKSEKAHSSPEFVNGIHQLRDLVAEQVADIRSSVSKEASLTISILANNMKDAAFDPLVDVFLTSLLKALGITIEKKALLVFDKLDSATKVKLIEEGGSGFDYKAPTATPSSSYPSGVTSKTTFRSRSLEADGSAKDVNPVVTRLYQPHYFQNRWQRRANLKEAQDLRECTFTPVILRKQLKTNVKHAAVPMLELDKLAIQGDLRGCVSPVNA